MDNAYDNSMRNRGLPDKPQHEGEQECRWCKDAIITAHVGRNGLRYCSVGCQAQYEDRTRRAGAGWEAAAPSTTTAAPKCGKCGYVMCQQFDSRPVNALADIATPNGKYICYHCEPVTTTAAARAIAREWMNTHHASFETNQKREEALVEIITRHLAASPSPTSETLGYVRRKCSSCGEGLGFSERDPCDRCSPATEAQKCVQCGHDKSTFNISDNPQYRGRCAAYALFGGVTLCGCKCVFPAAVQGNDAPQLTPEEADLVIGTIPLQALPGDDTEKQARELTRISERLDRLQVDQETLLELASTDVERAYELTIKDLIEDARYLLAAIRSRPVGEAVPADARASWIDNLVGAFDDSPTYEQIIANEKQARQWTEEGRCVMCGAFPVVAEMAADARELVERYLTWMPTAELHDMQIPALVEAITNYATAHGEKQWRAAIEVAAQTCEGLVTFTADHGCKCEPCAWCKALETAASAIRALLNKEKKDG